MHDIIGQLQDPDFAVANHGSVVLLTPRNGEARDYLKEHTDPDAMWFAGGLAVEPRYLDTLITGLELDGFTVAY